MSGFVTKCCNAPIREGDVECFECGDSLQPAQVKLELDKSFFETCGTHSLEGLMAEKGIFKPCKLELHFKLTNYAWRKQNGGPEIWLMPEFAPVEFLSSVLGLTHQGYEIEVTWST